VTDATPHNPPSAPSGPPSDAAGARYWRCIEEYADSPEFRRAVADEFPGYDPEELVGMGRRQFLKLAGASMALAGLTATGCRRWPEEQLAPFANRPDGRVPGEPEYYATMMQRDGVAFPVLAKSFDGRPIKVESHPQHPWVNTTDVFMQGDLLSLYDPDRARQVSVRSGEGTMEDPRRQASTWQAFRAWAQQHLPSVKGKVAILTAPNASPTFHATLKRVEDALGAKTYTWSPTARDPQLAGAALALGRPARPLYDLGKAHVVACFDADLLGSDLNQLGHAAGYAKGRAVADALAGPHKDYPRGTKMLRLYAAEPVMTLTGSNADERVAVKASRVPALVAAVAKALGVGSGADTGPALTDAEKGFVKHLTEDIVAANGRHIVAAGPTQPAEVHALCWAINAARGENPAVRWIQEPFVTDTAGTGGGMKTGEDHLTELKARINAGEIDTLIMIGGNPVFDAPIEANGATFADAIKRVPHTVRLSQLADETALSSEWHLPEAHWLESWGDGLAWDGTYTTQQPLIEPLYTDAAKRSGGRSAIEVLAMLAGDARPDGRSLVMQTFARAAGGSAGAAWRTAIHLGFVEGSAPAAKKVASASAIDATPVQADDAVEVRFAPHPTLWDGTYGNNVWLQELPQPLTQVTWNNPALVGVKTAKALGVNNGDVLHIETTGGGECDVPAFVVPGAAEGSITLLLGGGRWTPTLANARGVGSNVYTARTHGRGWLNTGSVAKTGKRVELATTMIHHLIDPDAVPKAASPTNPGAWAQKKRIGTKNDGGYLWKETTLDGYKKDPKFVIRDRHGDISLQLWDPPAPDGGWPQPAYEGAPKAFNQPHAWGMTIDNNACIGCGACVVACQAENNIPVVGPDMVRMSREMHWLRIDTYFKGKPDADDVQAAHMPVACVHCETAPCESVCPVAATVHDTEGLNTMVYNRCIGTRYCSNNCPYKVRRFNYFDYHAKPPLGSAKPWLLLPDQQQDAQIDRVKRLVFNPDVTVRMRGVMEKCTYCTQRIARAKIDAKAAWQRAGRPDTGWRVEDGAVMTACQTACPTHAITFGNLNDEHAKVSAARKSPRAYSLLEELNTAPRTRHLAKIRNPKT